MQQNLSLPLSVKARKNMLGSTPELFLLPLLEIIQVKMIQKSLDQQKCCLIGQTLTEQDSHTVLSSYSSVQIRICVELIFTSSKAVLQNR